MSTLLLHNLANMYRQWRGAEQNNFNSSLFNYLISLLNDRMQDIRPSLDTLYIYIYIFSIVIFHICMSLFESTLLSFCKPQSKFDLPTLHHGSRERKNSTEQIINVTLARIWTQVLGSSRRCSTNWATVSAGRFWILILISFSNLQPIPPLSRLHVDFWSTCIYIYIYIYMYIYTVYIIITFNILSPSQGWAAASMSKFTPIKTLSSQSPYMCI